MSCPDVLESYIVDVHSDPGGTLHLRQMFNNLLLLAAEVCEHVDRPADGLLYLTRALELDRRATTEARGLALRWRLLAAQAQNEASEAAFEASAEVSHRTGLRLLEMFALRDLKKHILDSDGRGEEGVRRLKAVLKEMKGPAAELTKLLGGGLDVEEILRS